MTLIITQPARFASPDVASFTIGQRGKFAVRVTGYPAPRIRLHGYLPKGLHSQVSNGAGLIYGTPAAGDAPGRYRLRLTATASVGTWATTATQWLTIIIDPAGS
jgi:hypothetical protein